VVLGSYVQHHTNPPGGGRCGSRTSPPRLWCACWSSHGRDHDTKPHRNGGHLSACRPMCSARSTTRVLAMRQLHRAQRRRSCPGLTAGRGCTPGPDRCQCLRRRGRREVLLDGTDSRAPPYKWGWTTAVGQRRCEDGHGTRSGGSRQAKRAVMIISGSRSSRSYTAAAVSLRDRLSRSGLPEPCLTPSGAAAAALLTLLGERAQVAAYVCHATCSGRSATQGCGATPPRLDTSVHISHRPRPVNRFQLLTALVLAARLSRVS